MLRQRITRCVSALISALLAPSLYAQSVLAAEPLKLQFVTHASFFSRETNQPTPLDPQVFVREARAPAGVGPQGIEHGVGYRTLHLADPANTQIFSATGKQLGLSAGTWLGASGTVTITPDQKGGADIAVTFEGLRPGGIYSLFENHFEMTPVGFTPLDGTGTRNSFVAKRDGSAAIKVHSPEMLTSTNAVLLVYHSDGKTYGQSRGQIGVTAHHQLIAKVP